MASVFESITRAAHLKRLRWPEERSASHLLWPVWARRVSAPKASDDDIGPFERAVLGCARARITDASHISELLLIDPKLVRFIQLALKDASLLDGELTLTDEGREALDHGEHVWRNAHVVYVFQCAVTGQVLHRITDTPLNFSAVAEQRDGGVKLENAFGADSRPLDCIRILPQDDSEPVVPRAEEVLHAVRLHRHERRFPYYATAEIPVEDVGDMPSATVLTQVRVIDQRAEPMFLVAVAYGEVQPVDRREDAIRILDPFGIAESRQITVAVREGLRDHAAAMRPISRLVPRIGPRESSQGVVDVANMWAHASEIAKEELRDRHHPNADYSDWAGLGHLISMQEAIEWLPESDMGPSQREQYLRKAAASGRSALESCLRSLADVHSLERLASFSRALGDTEHDRRFLAQRLTQAAKSCGLVEIGAGTWIPARFRVRASDLRFVVQRGNFYKLGGAIGATLLVAEEDERHPFRRAAEEQPDLLALLDRALGVAGEAAHDSRGDKITEEGVKSFAKLLYWIIRVLLGDIAQRKRNGEGN
jgi:hypothetical protein